MSRICSLELSCASAETALAKLWLCLVEHGIATPELCFEFPASNCVRLTVLSNASPEAMSLLRAWAAEWRNSHVGHPSRFAAESAIYDVKRLRKQIWSVPEAASPNHENPEHPAYTANSARKLDTL